MDYIKHTKNENKYSISILLCLMVVGEAYIELLQKERQEQATGFRFAELCGRSAGQVSAGTFQCSRKILSERTAEALRRRNLNGHEHFTEVTAWAVEILMPPFHLIIRSNCLTCYISLGRYQESRWARYVLWHGHSPWNCSFAFPMSCQMFSRPCCEVGVWQALMLHWLQK